MNRNKGIMAPMQVGIEDFKGVFQDQVRTMVRQGILDIIALQGEVEQRLAEDAFGLRQEGDEQAANPAVAVQNRMDRLELDIGECRADQHGDGDGLAVDEFLEVVKFSFWAIGMDGTLDGAW